VGGATNWQPPAFHPGLSLVFVPAEESSSIFSKSMPEHVQRSRGELFTGSGTAPKEYDPVIRALGANDGSRRWEYRIPRTKGVGGQSGLLATAGNVVFGASEGTLAAVNAANGEPLWSIFLGGSTYSPPISFLVDGRQVLVVVAGRSVFLLDLGSDQGAPLDAGAASDAR
jgi:alcohol dehydrogenase (cytochrome c)